MIISTSRILGRKKIPFIYDPMYIIGSHIIEVKKEEVYSKIQRGASVFAKIIFSLYKNSPHIEESYHFRRIITTSLVLFS